MKLQNIAYIKNMPGLYNIAGENKHGILAESLTDGKVTHVANSAQMGNLSTMTVYTASGELLLPRVFRKMNDHGAPVDAKATDETVKQYFKMLLPDYDEKRFYVSHMKKIVTWFNMLKDKQVDFGGAVAVNENSN